jgi:mRNA interferase MazF
MKRGEVWLIDLGLAAKARPTVISSVPFQDNEKAVVTYVARSLQRRGGRFEVDHQSLRFRPGVFDAQNIGAVPTAIDVPEELYPFTLTAVGSAVPSG